MFIFKRTQFLPISINEAWDFFSCPTNLSIITPKKLGLTIKGNLDYVYVKEGDIINYTVRPLLGIPMKWKTKILSVNAPHHFIDKQLKGPYKFWEHKHTFEEKDGGVLMTDEVYYQLPFSVIFSIFNGLVKNKLNHIFDYRTKKLNQIFNYGHTY